MTWPMWSLCLEIKSPTVAFEKHVLENPIAESAQSAELAHGYHISCHGRTLMIQKRNDTTRGEFAAPIVIPTMEFFKIFAERIGGHSSLPGKVVGTGSLMRKPNCH